MTIGGSIALIILGAILAWAVTFEIAGLNINVIGFILMVGGVIGLIFGLIMYFRASAVTGDRVVERRRDVY